MMPFNLSTIVGNEWKYIGDTEPVTLSRRLANGTFDAGTPVANAFSPGFRLEVSTGKATLAKDANVFVLWQNQTGDPAPKPSDVIQEASGARWSAVKVDVQAWGLRFVCDVIKER